MALTEAVRGRKFNEKRFGIAFDLADGRQITQLEHPGHPRLAAQFRQLKRFHVTASADFNLNRHLIAYCYRRGAF